MNTIYRYLLLISMMLLSQSLFAGSTIQFPARTYTVNEAAGQAELPVVRLNDFDTIVSVEYFTVEATASGGQDFTATSGTLTFAAGETNRAIMVPILNDGLYEALERFQVALTNVTGDAVLGMMRVATVSIQDNETPVQLEFSAYRAREDEGSVLIGLVRGGEGEALTLEYATANGTALAGEDYAAMSGTLAFEAGENLKLLTVPIFNDGLKESNETLQLYLTNAPAGMLGAAKTATITLVDNDPGVQFEFKREWVHETDGAVEVKVIRGNDGGLGPFTVDYATTAGTAQAGVHYVETAGTLSFGTGEMSRSVTVPILNDLAASADRTFQIQLGQLSGGAVPGPTQTLTVTILDMTGMQAHAFSRMQLLPDRCLELILEGGVHSRYQSFFDLYSVETSADLDLWQTWRTLECTGAAGDALRCVDSTPPGAGSRFYRMSSEPAITPIPPPTPGRL
ncbi:MAG: hypothetical protein KJ072_15395 [Verrucomicrobia bacterium]|nr:hypothetical protein [Verrucomicrobiota bacterium]